MKLHSFVCEHCGKKNAAADHCPACLWSKHTQVKGKACRGMMEPVSIALKKSQCMITHRCERCGHQTRRKTTVSDNLEAIARLSIHDNEAYSETGLNPGELFSLVSLEVLRPAKRRRGEPQRLNPPPSHHECATKAGKESDRRQEKQKA